MKNAEAELLVLEASDEVAGNRGPGRRRDPSTKCLVKQWLLGIFGL